MDRVTTSPAGDDLRITTCVLNHYHDGYNNAVVAMTPSSFDDEWKEAYQTLLGGAPKYGARFAEGANLQREISEINSEIFKITLEKDVIKAPSSMDKNAIVVVSSAQQRTRFQNSAKKAEVPWKEGTRSGWETKAELAQSVAPNGAIVRHIKMADDCVMSVVFLEDLDANGAGEWMFEALEGNLQWKTATVCGPNVSDQRTVDLSKVDCLKFVFDKSKADFRFGKASLYIEQMKQTVGLRLNNLGLDARAITVAVGGTRGLGMIQDPAEASVKIDRPFVACFTYKHARPDGSLTFLPTFVTKVVK